MLTVTPRPTSDRATTAHLERLLQRGTTPGLQYTVVAADEVRFAFAGGWADIATRRPMEMDTTLMAYSMSKTMTAIAVLQLVEAGQLDLDAPLGEWMPYGSTITVRHLLTHTAGIPSPLPLRWVHTRASHATFGEREALAALVRKHPRPLTQPGARYRYSNLGYWLLGQLVERVTGTDFCEHVRANVIAPLDISPTELSFEVPDPARHAAGYLERYSLFNLLKGLLIDASLVGETTGRWVHIRDHYVNAPAMGGLLGTASAFARVLQDQLAPRSCLLSDETRRLLMQPQRTRDGREIPMTPGWHVTRRGTERVLFKEGGGGGFHCMMRLYPTAGVGTVLMTNATGIDVAREMDTLDSRFVRA